MTIYEKLLEEFGAAIYAIYGDKADEEFDEDEVTKESLTEIARKVAFYLDK